MTTRSHHDAVGLADGPQVDPTVMSACSEQAARALAQRQTGNGTGVSLELLCPAAQEETWLLPCPRTVTHVHLSEDSRKRHDILVEFAAAMMVTGTPMVLDVSPGE